jgi:hypothetical protein
MLANVAIDATGGSVPYVGVLFDAVWKTNRRSLELALDELVVDVEGEHGGGHREHDDTTADNGDDGPVIVEVERAAKLARRRLCVAHTTRENLFRFQSRSAR